MSLDYSFKFAGQRMHCISFSTFAGNGLLLQSALLEILVKLQHPPFFEGRESQIALL